MSLDASSIFDAALSLPEPVRSQLADQLIISLAPPKQLSDAEWCDELRRRISQVEAGTAETMSSEEALAELRSRRKRREGQ